MKYSIDNMRIGGFDKNYWLAQLEEFANMFDSKKIERVSFGKQDIRGAFSITLFDTNKCVPDQLMFENKGELLGYVRGCNRMYRERKNAKLTTIQ